MESAEMDKPDKTEEKRSPLEAFEEYASRMRKLRYFLLTSGDFPENTSRREKDTIRKIAENHEIQGGVLYYKRTIKLEKRKLRVLTTKEDVYKVINVYHKAHCGIGSTVKGITTKYWFKPMQDVVTDYIRRCVACQKHEKIKTVAPELTSIPITGPWDMVGMDLIGPLEKTSKGNEYALTITDYFTKYVVAYPIPDKTAASVASRLTEFFAYFGNPKKLLSDNGSEFVNTLNMLLCGKWKVQRVLSRPYHPQTNGLDERTNQTLKDRLGKSKSDQEFKGLEWDDLIYYVVSSINACEQASTKYSPYYLLFGRHPNTNIGLTDDLPEEDESEQAEGDLEAYIQHASKVAADVHSVVKDNVEKSQNRQRKQYAKTLKKKGVKSFTFKVGDMVWLRLKSKSRQIRPKVEWDGPYAIMAIDESEMTVQKGTEEPTRCHHTDLKPYNSPIPASSGVNSGRQLLSCPVTSNPATTTATAPYNNQDDGSMPEEADQGQIASLPDNDSLPKEQATKLDKSGWPEDFLDRIIDGEWLSWEHIREARTLLKLQYPQVQGFGSTFVPETFVGQFCQIVHVNDNHWATISTYNAEPSTVHVYDSLYCQPSSEPTKRAAFEKKLAQHTGTAHSALTYIFQGMQEQRGGDDCGLFAIATALAICRNEHPSCLTWDQQSMRGHLVECFMDGFLRPFPLLQNVPARPTKFTAQLNVFCKCRLLAGGKMLQCDECQEWFHFKCVGIRRFKSGKPWSCDSCSGI